jgi:hypothetical protein
LLNTKSLVRAAIFLQMLIKSTSLNAFGMGKPCDEVPSFMKYAIVNYET